MILKSKIIKFIQNNLYAVSLYARQIAGTLVLFVIARYLSVYDYGLFSSYKAITSFILLFACMGYNEYILVSCKKNVDLVRKKIALFLINAFCILALTSLVSYFVPIELHFIFILVLLRVFFDNTFFTLILPYFQSANKFFVISYINIVYALGVILITAISYIFKLSLLKFLILSCIVGCINFIHCSFYAKLNYVDAIKNLKKYFKLIDKTIFHYMGVLVAFLLYSQIPSLYVSCFLTKQDAALYFSAFSIAGVINLFIAAQNQKMVPEMINASIAKVKNILKQNFILVMSINLLVLLTFLLVGKIILFLIYGNMYYQNGYWLLIIFTLSSIGLALANVYGAYMTSNGKQYLKIKMQIEAIFITIIIILLFQVVNGLYAAAFAYFSSGLYIGIRYYMKTKELLMRDAKQSSQL